MRLWDAVGEELGQLDSRLKAKAVLMMGEESSRSLGEFMASMHGQMASEDRIAEELAPHGLVTAWGYPVIVDHRFPPQSFALMPSEFAAEREKVIQWIAAHGLLEMGDERWARKVERV